MSEQVYCGRRQLTYMAFGEWTDPKTGRNFIILRAPEKGVRWRDQVKAMRRIVNEIGGKTGTLFYLDGDNAAGTLWEKHAGAQRFQWASGEFVEFGKLTEQTELADRLLTEMDIEDEWGTIANGPVPR